MSDFRADRDSRSINFSNQTDIPLHIHLELSEDGNLIIDLKNGSMHDVPIEGTHCNLKPGHFIDFALDEVNGLQANAPAPRSSDDTPS